MLCYQALFELLLPVEIAIGHLQIGMEEAFVTYDLSTWFAFFKTWFYGYHVTALADDSAQELVTFDGIARLDHPGALVRLADDFVQLCFFYLVMSERFLHVSPLLKL